MWETFFSMLDLGWVASQFTNGNPIPFVVWTAFVFAASFTIGALFQAFASRRKIVRELGRKPGFERVNTLDRLIEKADELDGELLDIKGEIASETAAETEPARSASGKIMRNEQGLRLFTGPMAAAAIASIDDSKTDWGRRFIPFGEHEDAVLASLGNKDGVFMRGHMGFVGYRGKPTDAYMLAREWWDYLDEHPEHIEFLRGRAKGEA